MLSRLARSLLLPLSVAKYKILLTTNHKEIAKTIMLWENDDGLTGNQKFVNFNVYASAFHTTKGIEQVSDFMGQQYRLFL